MRTTKISISVDGRLLARARRAAKADGLSLSAFIARGIGRELEDHERNRAADALIETWGPESVPTEADWEGFRRAIARPVRRRKKAA